MPDSREAERSEQRRRLDEFKAPFPQSVAEFVRIPRVLVAESSRVQASHCDSGNFHEFRYESPEMPANTALSPACGDTSW
jgi:hypothetical protein